MDEFTESDFMELEGYGEMEASSRMKEIINWLR